MSASDAREALRTAAARLERISEQLADPATEDSRAVELAREAAEIAAEVGAHAAEAARAASEGAEPA